MAKDEKKDILVEILEGLRKLGESSKEEEPQGMPEGFYEDINLLLNRDIFIPAKMYWLYDDHEGAINDNAAKKASKSLLLLDSFSPEQPITIKLNTEGGCVLSGMAIFDTIKSLSSNTVIIGEGKIFSMGAIILQAACLRCMTKNAKLMIHDGTFGMGGDPKIVKTWVDDNERDIKDCYKMFEKIMKNVKRSSSLPKKVKERMKKHGFKLNGKGFNVQEIEILFDRDMVLNAKESLRMNIIDKIV